MEIKFLIPLLSLLMKTGEEPTLLRDNLMLLDRVELVIKHLVDGQGKITTQQGAILLILELVRSYPHKELGAIHQITKLLALFKGIWSLSET